MPQVLHFNNITHARNKIDEGTRQTVSYRKSRTAKAVLCREIRWPGGRFVYTPDRPLPCGAVAYIVLDDDVKVELVGKAASFDAANCPVGEAAKAAPKAKKRPKKPRVKNVKKQKPAGLGLCG